MKRRRRWRGRHSRHGQNSGWVISPAMPKRSITAEDLLKLQYLGDPQISPDGTRVLFTKKHVNEKNKYITNLHTVDMEGKTQQWTQGEGGDGHGRWSPDGRQIAFISGREKPNQQI